MFDSFYSVSNVNPIDSFPNGVDEIIQVFDPDFIIIPDFFDNKVSKTEDIDQPNFKISIDPFNIIIKVFSGYDFKTNQQEARRKNNTQKQDIDFELFLLNFKLEYDIFTSTSKIFTSIQDIEIIDHISSSNWRKFLGYNVEIERSDDSCMFEFEIILVNRNEIRIDVLLLPVCFRIDQDTLESMIVFFSYGGVNNDVASTEPFFRLYTLM